MIVVDLNVLAYLYLPSEYTRSQKLCSNTTQIGLRRFCGEVNCAAL